MKLRTKVIASVAATLAISAPAAVVTTEIIPSATAEAAPAGIPTAGLPVLRSGATGNAVRAVQAAVGTGVDGNFGPKTVTAVQAFQRSRGVTADGVVGPDTWGKILSQVRQGSTGVSVKALQGRLGLPVDGSFGPATKTSVLNFQRANGLPVDGVVSPDTWAKLLGGSSGGGTSCRSPRGVYRNGNLPSSALVTAPGNDDKISCYALRDFTAMNNAYRAAHGGRSIKINSGYRTYAQQKYLWNCYITKRCNNGNLAARPGTSNHGYGLALDVGDDKAWLHRNSARYGWVFDVASEDWHMTYKR